MRRDPLRTVSVCTFIAAIHSADRHRRRHLQPIGARPSRASFKLAQWIREEFEETAGLAFTVDEAARFWALDEATCRDVLSHLAAVGFLTRDDSGRYRQVGVVE